MYTEAFMQRALALSAQALDQPGTEPFGAVIVKDGQVVGEGFNHARAKWDPTAHGEVEAIRDACQRLGTLQLDGCELYTSCEPCALCVCAMGIVGISALYYGASLEQSHAAIGALPASARPPIDTDALRREAGATIEARRMPATQALDAEAIDILKQWAARRS
ncbi:nucleoside deaminase [Piscinibacter gummiphilus]|uniref:Nucleoside deaminase n=1 Tax=Piscinibacter gummiphilus TaxID=946333 RepID=A0ABZ0CY03_9BURK|nr:nucleoside deaminase [Piscinibacter gummiphilus]WOB09862.1 nucleoside deaminase [Piscinibacter gummiphilus]